MRANPRPPLPRRNGAHLTTITRDGRCCSGAKCLGPMPGMEDRPEAGGAAMHPIGRRRDRAAAPHGRERHPGCREATHAPMLPAPVVQPARPTARTLPGSAVKSLRDRPCRCGRHVLDRFTALRTAEAPA